jgi:hypothetical protein
LGAVGDGHAPGYEVVDGEWRWPGERPEGRWHKHDWVGRSLRVLVGGRLVRRVVLRRRWRLAGTNITHLSRSPDEAGRSVFAATVVVLKVWAWLAGTHGVERVEEVHNALTGRPEPRTVQRWLARLRLRAMALQQALRDAVLEEGGEPWPAEKLFPGGLPPPEGLRRRRWKNPECTYQVYRGLLWLFGGAVRLHGAIPCLLARARGRWPDPANALF